MFIRRVALSMNLVKVIGNKKCNEKLWKNSWKLFKRIHLKDLNIMVLINKIKHKHSDAILIFKKKQ